MSRIGNRPIEIPDDVEVSVDGQTLRVSGPAGELERQFSDYVELNVSDEDVVVERIDDTREARGHHGLVRSLVSNMVRGAKEGYEKVLEINGVGYRAEERADNFIRFDLGYSHPIMFELPDEVDCEIERETTLKLTSADNELLGQVASKIRALRAPEPYKGKGIRYRDERIRRKAGKTGA